MTLGTIPGGATSIVKPPENIDMARAIILSCRSRHDMQNKVAAIKGVRMLCGMGLKESKDFVEKVEPGHSETLSVSHAILEPRFSDGLALLKESGLTVKTIRPNNAARRGLAEGIAGLVTYATMAGQYDISRALLDVMETYCPEPNDPDEEEEKDGETD